MVTGIGEEIRRKRLERGFSQTELAGLVRVHRMTISSWELEHTSPHRLHRWMLEKVLGMKLDK